MVSRRPRGPNLVGTFEIPQATLVVERADGRIYLTIDTQRGYYIAALNSTEAYRLCDLLRAAATPQASDRPALRVIEGGQPTPLREDKP